MGVGQHDRCGAHGCQGLVRLVTVMGTGAMTQPRREPIVGMSTR
jgi:hypothetical protein